MADWEFVGQGGVADIANIATYEDQIPEGAQFQIGLELRVPVDPYVADTVKSQMIEKGVPDAVVKYSGNTMQIYGRKGFPWLAVIAAIILATLVLVIILVSWSIYKKVVPPGLQSWIVPVLFVGAAILLIGPGIKNTKEQHT